MRLATVIATALVMGSACQVVSAAGAPAQPPPAGAPVSCPSPTRLAPAGPTDWPVYGGAGDRHGVDGRSPAARHLSPLWGARLDGATFTQPLAVQGLIIVATEHDSVYAFDAVSGCLAWRTSLGAPLDLRHARLQCNNIVPELGVTSTPAVDTASETVYAVAYLTPGRYELDALDLASGSVRWRRAIDLPGSDPLQQLSRPAVALAGGRAYVSFGGRAGDCGNYHGFVIGVNEDGSGDNLLFQASPSRGAAVWAPGGPVVMPGGDLLLAIGNSDERSRYDGSEAVVRLSTSLELRGLFAPRDWAHLNLADLDIGSVGPSLLADGRVFQAGKAGMGYLLDGDRLGGVGGQLFSAPVGGRTTCYAIGATAVLGPTVYVPCDHGLAAIRVSGSRFSLAWQGPDFRSGSPIVAGGLVWDYDFEGGLLWGFSAARGDVRQRVAVGIGEHFVAPSASAGRLYVPASHRLYAFSFA